MKRLIATWASSLLLLLLLLLLVVMVGVASAADLVVYDDALQNGFQDWSWATHDLANSAPVWDDPATASSRSIAMEPDEWQGVYLHSPTAIDVADYDALRFQIHGDNSGGQLLSLALQLGTSTLGTLDLDPAPAAGWQQRTVAFADLGLSSGTYDGLIFQDGSGGDQATVYLDQIELLENDTPPQPPQAIAITIDPVTDRRPINPLIYGVNFGDAAQLAEPGFPLRRWGGNTTTRYNWRADVDNRAFDWFFMNIARAVADPGLLPDGSSADVFIDQTLTAGAEPILTIPMIGWVARDEREKRWSFSVATYGPQLQTECTYFDPPYPSWCQADAGNGTCNPADNTTGYCSADGLITGNDATDTSQVIDTSWVTDWMAHIASRTGTAAAGGPRLWALDNEPMLWDSTHRDVHPLPLSYDQLWSLTVDYATAIKSQDAQAEVLGPVVWGWCAYFSSAADAAYANGSCIDGPDRQAHGGLALIPWYLQQVCQHQSQTGVRLVDYLDVHVYPQGGVSGLGGASSSEDPTTAARRLRSVKELWHPSYISESWISDTIALIPRLRSWIDSYCPGIGIAVTEYKWGPDNGTTGALAQAEVLALFGREGVDLATRWVAPEPGTRAEDAFRLYLSYDGAGARIEGDSVSAASADHDAVAAYAVSRSDGRLYILLFNKDTVARNAQVAVAGGLTGGAADIYRFDGGNPLAPAGSLTPDPGGAFELELPPRSATLVVSHQLTSEIFSDGFESGDTSRWSLVVD